MIYAPVRQLNTARLIARSAQHQILHTTGMKMDLVMYSGDDLVKTPERMLKVIAVALEMNPQCYRTKTRHRDYVELRFIGALFLRRIFPNVTLFEIAALFGGQDHSSVISGISRAYSLIKTGDLKFIAKYNKALQSVNLWLEKEVSGCA